jgi:hypothetical protein
MVVLDLGVPGLGSWKQDDHEFKASLGYLGLFQKTKG